MRYGQFPAQAAYAGQIDFGDWEPLPRMREYTNALQDTFVNNGEFYMIFEGTDVVFDLSGLGCGEPWPTMRNTLERMVLYQLGNDIDDRTDFSESLALAAEFRRLSDLIEEKVIASHPHTDKPQERK